MHTLLKNLYRDGIVSEDEFDYYAAKYYLESKLFYEYLISRGLPLSYTNNTYELTIFDAKIEDQVFCIVDIETNGPKIFKNDIIEIGAIKIQNGKIIDKFDTLVHAPFVSRGVSAVTGIVVDDIIDSPSIKKVLNDFRIFLGTSVFVAHNISFDYNFVSDSFAKYGLESMLNPKFCTFKLACKCIKAPKHGLKTLKKELGINIDHHRAYNDAYSAYKVLLHCMKNINEDIKTAKELINFAK